MLTEWQRLQRAILLGIVTLLALTLLAYAGDWLMWRVRVARGNGMATVNVTRMVVAPLKGNREEYYMDGTEDAPCSRSLFPQGGNSACWWLARHHVILER